MKISMSSVILAVLGLSMAAPTAQEATIDSRSVQDTSDIVSRSESMMIHDLSRRAPKSKKELAALVMKMFKGLKPTPSSAKAPAAKKARDLNSLQERSELIDELIDLVTRKAGDPPPSITVLAQTFLDAVNQSGEDPVKWRVIMLKAGWQFTAQGTTNGWLHMDTQRFYTQAAVEAAVEAETRTIQ
ncbi:hypothetical protein C8J56DRAFT_888776 [Mycena floridula]|nr:hypothetical protein C8J56DRAFT_888775 [Mycena floridula]KAJ7589176.1 hypothetical protein C8J56DRAFT_888776 [Mycena floridula]